MAVCETCWTEASRRAAYSSETTADIYPKVLRENQPWSPELPCGGIEVNGKPWTWCEQHMQPRGHFERHTDTRPAPFTRYSGTAGSKVDAALGGDQWGLTCGTCGWSTRDARLEGHVCPGDGGPDGEAAEHGGTVPLSTKDGA